MTDEQDWIDDLTDPSDEQDDSPTLFEENFRKMVSDDDVGDMAISTLENQVERIGDVEILEDAVEADDRDEAEEIYQQRIGELEGESEDSEETVEETPEASDETADESDDEDEEESDVLNDLVDDEDEEGEDTVEVSDEDPEDVLEEAVEEESTESSEEAADEEAVEEEPDNPDEDETSQDDSGTPQPDTGGNTSGLPDVDVGSLAPDAISREQAAEQDKQRTILVWGPEGSGKSHVAHSAPEPICYIDTEGKADELAEKFDGKRIHYFVADNYKEAKSAMEQALDVLHKYLESGFRGTLVVDSMTAMWEYAKVDYAKYAYQTENLSEVNFQSELEGEKDWTKIKARHNEEFRERILESPFNVVFTSGQKEDYDAVFDGGGKQWVPDGEKWNRYAVKDVVRLRRDGSGKTVGDLKKAAKTRYSFAGLVWPTFDSIYEAIDEIYAAEQSPGEVDVTDWPFDVIDGQPVGNSPEGSDEEEED